MSRRRSLGEIVMPIDDKTRQFAVAWAEDVIELALTLVWRGFDRVMANELKGRHDLADLDPEQLEREITQWHSLSITVIWAQVTNGYSSLIPVHEHHEFEKRKGGKAVPPSNDIGFVHRDNKRLCLPIEGKLLPTAKALSEYVKDVTDKYVMGVAAPFVGECGMVGYLLQGTASGVFNKLASELKQSLLCVESFRDRPHRTTEHSRAVAPRLRVHHMVMSCVPTPSANDADGTQQRLADGG